MSKVHGGHGVQACVSWVPAKDGAVPYNAIEAANGLYIGRAAHQGDVTPAKVCRGHTSAYISYGEKEHPYKNYEVLCNTGLQCFGQETSWVHANNGQVPSNALAAGQTGGHEPLFIARGQINGDWCIGKVHGSHGCAYFPWGGEEHRAHNYEVFCFN